MNGESQRGARWLTGAATVMRRGALPGLRPAARREPSAVGQLRRSNEPPSGLGGSEARPVARLDEGCAVLRVTRAESGDGQGAYTLHGWCGDLALACPAGPTRLVAPAVSLGNVSGDGEYPSEILRAIQLWSGNQPELARWINRIRVRHGTALRLVVWDDTGYELPWELFWTPADPGRGLEGGPLGARTVLVRWTTVHDVGQDLPRERGECHGRVLSYLHQDMADDGRVFARYAHQSHGEMTPFFSALDSPADHTGLVYMGCHGTYGPAVPRLSLGDRTWAEFNGQSMRVLDADRSLVCLNACHSGRFVSNRAQGEYALRGFAELFLRKGAGGCIVTAGKVGDHEARKLVRRLVHEVATHPRQPVAETLRAFRARAVDDFGPLTAIPTTRNDDGQVDRVGQKRVLRLLYAFMFHYYGHPLTTLRLAADDGRSAGGGSVR
ncbi:CHAT domain-containing protein [Streptomyces sp. NPDC007264]|uniref:CHAT domain-containing protein n=1 Tax=Streptomyces sp. NPDC007264 TaxID=3364777 RepID=UPI0036D7E49B